MDQPIVFGAHDNLVGIASRPHESAQSSDVAVIMLTAGMLHNVGPFRMHVDLARHLASQGITSLRFDLSGIGESLGVGSTGSSIDRAAAETGEAMDWLERNLGFKRFVLFGLCSGADDAMHTALNDQRVIGLVGIDGLGFRTRRFYFHRIVSHYLPRILSPSKWMNLAKRNLSGVESAPKTLQTGADVREFPDQAEAERQLQQLATRDVRMHFIYTGGVSEYFNHEKQFAEMLPNVDLDKSITMRYFPQMDHVALLCEDRQVLVAHICETIAEICPVVADAQQDDLEPPVLLPFAYPAAGSDEAVV